MRDGDSTSRRRPLLVALAVVLALLVAGGVVIAALAIRADPAMGDDRPAGRVVGEDPPRGTRMDPARIGEDALVWATADGGEVSVSVDRAETVARDADDVVPDADSGARCQELFVIELTVRYEGDGTFDPSSELLVQRMSGPFEAHGASPGLDILAEPLLVPDQEIGGGEARTGTVMYFGSGDARSGGNLVISTDDGRPLHVATGAADAATGC